MEKIHVIKNEGQQACEPGLDQSLEEYQCIKNLEADPDFFGDLFRFVLFSKTQVKDFDWKKIRKEKVTAQDRRERSLRFSVPLKKSPEIRMKLFVLFGD